MAGSSSIEGAIGSTVGGSSMVGVTRSASIGPCSALGASSSITHCPSSATDGCSSSINSELQPSNNLSSNIPVFATIEGDRNLQLRFMLGHIELACPTRATLSHGRATRHLSHPQAGHPHCHRGHHSSRLREWTQGNPCRLKDSPVGPRHSCHVPPSITGDYRIGLLCSPHVPHLRSY